MSTQSALLLDRDPQPLRSTQNAPDHRGIGPVREQRRDRVRCDNEWEIFSIFFQVFSFHPDTSRPPKDRPPNHLPNSQLISFRSSSPAIWVCSQRRDTEDEGCGGPGDGRHGGRRGLHGHRQGLGRSRTGHWDTSPGDEGWTVWAVGRTVHPQWGWWPPKNLEESGSSCARRFYVFWCFTELFFFFWGGCIVIFIRFVLFA